MRKQQQIWENEHKNPKILPTLEYLEPSTSVVEFLKFLKANNAFRSGKVVDVGSGKGRNAIYLAKLGYKVYCIDYIKIALEFTRTQAKKENVSSNIHLFEGEIDKKWPFENDFFDLAIDCFSSIDIETKKSRDIYKNELFRTLMPGGYALVAVVSKDDEIEKGFAVSSPGAEPNSVIWPGTGKFQKNYDEKELGEFYKEFKFLQIKKYQKQAFKLGRKYQASNIFIILRKPYGKS